jgi:UDP-glucose 4-epimerase
MAEKILVTGGAGYIGSVVVSELLERGYLPVVVDDLSCGHRQALPRGAELLVLNISDGAALDRVLAEHRPQAVMHFAAFIEAGESMQRPEKYFRNNTANTLTLLEAMLHHGVKRLVFSSTAALYGTPEETPIEETAPLKPSNAYGESKRMAEQMLDWMHRVHGLRYSCLRYFNAAGAAGEQGEDHHPESHLIPIALEVALGRRKEVAIFGSDYPTADGTCVRDYVHVKDLAAAHLLVLEALREKEKLIYNLGNGRGFSVREVIDTVRRVTGHAIPARESPRRQGDPAVLVASSEKIKKELGWRPQYADLESIVRSAWNWRKAHPNGYAAS